MGLIRDAGTRIGFGSRVSACDGMVRQVVCARVKEGSSYLRRCEECDIALLSYSE